MQDWLLQKRQNSVAGLRAMVPEFLTWPIEKKRIADDAQRAATLDNSRHITD